MTRGRYAWMWLVTLMLVLVAPPRAEAGIGSLLRAAVKAGSKAGAKGAAKAGAGAAAKGAAKAGTATAAKGVVGAGAVALADGALLRFGDEAAEVGMYVTRQADGGFAGVLRHGDELTEVRGPMAGLLDDAAARSNDLDLVVDRSVLAHLDELDQAGHARLFLESDGLLVPLRRIDGAPQIKVDDSWLELGETVAEFGLEMALEAAGSIPELVADEIQFVDEDCTGEQWTGSLGSAVERAEPGDTVVVLHTTPGPSQDAVHRLAREHDVDIVLVDRPDVCVDGAPPDPALVASLAQASSHAALWATHSEGQAPQVSASDKGLVVVGSSIVATHGYADEEPPLWAQVVATFLCCGCPLIGVVVALGALVRVVSRSRGEA